MRKLFLTCVVLLMVFLPIIALAERFSSGTIPPGISFPVPDGFTAQEFEDEEKGIVGVHVVANDLSVLYILGCILDETDVGIESYEDGIYVGFWLDDITDEQMEAVGRLLFGEKAFEFKRIIDYPSVEFYATDGSKMVDIGVFGGSYICFAALVSTGPELTEEQYDAYFAFLDSMN